MVWYQYIKFYGVPIDILIFLEDKGNLWTCSKPSNTFQLTSTAPYRCNHPGVISSWRVDIFCSFQLLWVGTTSKISNWLSVPTYSGKLKARADLNKLKSTTFKCLAHLLLGCSGLPFNWLSIINQQIFIINFYSLEKTELQKLQQDNSKKCDLIFLIRKMSSK